ncbi:adenosylcobinamide-GDP ribazoletransferase [Microtetraspora sp. AC03309]|uniref:adenosylcobinamide-GDP ribazoletransferase n=1 Tax=Microtetraspora sp. AC03309 TaxID=2779376 RepID=UPI001E31CBE0|nr:adenosylcobinamide-GDP ribazoletransferase [Microtetraspora sp. AC03309]MCC5579189.1 adenosylcobinamide-GDP ribazoletransferase [Microtetraspora sp. AC03309]
MSGTPEQDPASTAAAWRFALGTLSVFPVRAIEVNRRIAGRGMLLAPLAGLVLGVAAAAVSIGARWASGSALLASVLAVGALAWLTRCLHLDGLADLADGLGSGKPADQALDIMKRSDIGPFGVVTLVFTLLAQVAALTRMDGWGPPALIAACVTGRLAITWACRVSVPAARPGGLGAFVAGTVRRGPAIAVTAAALLCAAVLLPALEPSPLRSVIRWAPVAYPLAVLAGLVAAALLRRRAVRRLGGITGDVLGALVECATTTTLLLCAFLLR